ncbi:MAG TPA: YkvA family protein [Burkholderiales bacterium]|nr:YkvA family protein [Burkholderiales bacterium]
MMNIAALKARVRQVKVDLIALSLAARDPRTPWYAKLIVAGCVAYALSPVDIIPDFIPVIGLVDDLIFIPLALALAVRFIPDDVLADCRSRAGEIAARPASRAAAVVIVAAWIALAALALWLLMR